MRRPALSTAMLALAILFPSAGAAQAPDARPGLPRMVRAVDNDAPDGTFQGVWSSDKDPAGMVQISRLPNETIIIVAAGRFQAAGFASGPSLIALTCIPGPARSADANVRYGALRIERRDDRTLRVRFSEDLGSTPTAEETWTFRSRKLERRPPDVPAAVGGDDLPRFGEYVYVEELPEAVTKVAPDYPQSARAGGVDGQVMVQALVGRDGLVKDVKVVKSIPELDDAAVTAVRQWRFKPAMSKGAPVAVWVAVPVKFSLH